MTAQHSPAPVPSGSRRLAVGLLMGTAAAVIGGGWQVATRHATTAGLAPIAPEDLVLLRYGVPALLLAPVWWRLASRLRTLDARRLLLMFAGAGIPFGFVAISGTQFAPAVHMGVLMAGASPLFAALLAWLLWRQVPRREQGIGLALMALGVALLAAPALAGWGLQSWRGDVLFLVAALLWAIFTLSFRGSGLTPWEAAAFVNAGSMGVALVWVLARGGVGLADAPLPALAWQLVWQGLLAGVMGLWTFAVAIQYLGAAQAAAFGALAPVVSALGGWWWLGDELGALEAAAVCAAVLGVLMASGAVGWAYRHRRGR